MAHTQHKTQENRKPGRPRTGTALRHGWNVSLDPATVAVVERMIDTTPRLRRSGAVERAVWAYAAAHGLADQAELTTARERGWLPGKRRK